jgi:hypothetical protein
MSDQDSHKIVPIWEGVEIPNQAGASNQVITALELALERARRGELTAIAMVAVMPSRNVYRSWSRGLCDRATLIGAIESMKHEMIAEWFDEVQPENYPIDIDPAS